MSTTTVPTRRPATNTAHRLGPLRVLHSEWIKFTTLRSPWWSIGIVAVLTIGIALLVAAAANAAGFDGIQAVVMPIQFTVLLAGILGVITVTGEYSTGVIRSTLTADPVRGSVLAAKAAVVAGASFLSSFVIFLVAALAAAPLLASNGMSIEWSDPSRSILPILAASFSMAVFALLGVGFGFILRNGAGAIAATVGLLFVVPIVISMFGVIGDGWQWVSDLGQYLPMAAAQSIIIPQDGWGLSVPVGLVTLIAWVALTLGGGWAVLRGRDA